MSDLQHFNSVWDALESDPVQAANMKLRSSLMIAINEQIEEAGLTQVETAKILHITQPRVSALAKGKIEEFRVDTLINIAHRLGLHVTMKIAA
ncbi:MAG: XRE family transcriptional regulator [Acidiferrobacteraceae bacterium]|jgi:predicted XRE-type DNA-binding protein|nr:XRE family transcriptional regulator [Acidiferrobacteraceae bacterium]MBT4405470.1 XRE family transcriptional regulator [Acidiferrobacteraceae bacterium]MBT5981865.1 XRE family transcriptional regulator [Acidiferrobacteraceae bacterium]MBT7518169.1 XRE family transcriptional regulator [Acidiferrobacteraceae bacterium]